MYLDEGSMLSNETVFLRLHLLIPSCAGKIFFGNIDKDKILSLSLQKGEYICIRLKQYSECVSFSIQTSTCQLHVHVENGDGKAKIQGDPDIVIVENKGVKPGDLKKALGVVKLYKKDIIKTWNEHFSE